MISLVLAESSIELVPAKIQSHPSVVRHAKRLGRLPSEILLDNAWHFAAMRDLDCQIKRGRPDIVHFSILTAVATPLYQMDKMRLYIHTINDKVICFGSGVRIPKSYHRFTGIMHNLYRDDHIRSNESTTLLELHHDMSMPKLLQQINPTVTIGLSTQGVLSTCGDIGTTIPDNACIIIGGFQKGHFSDSTLQLMNSVYAINSRPLEGHVVVARMIYEYEKILLTN